MKKIYITRNNGSNLWGLHRVIEDLSTYLQKEKYIEVASSLGTFTVAEEFKYEVPDCEALLYDEEKDILKAVSYSEGRTQLWDIFQKRNNKNDILVVCHQGGWGLNEFNIPSNIFKIKNINFYTLREFNSDIFFNKRKSIPFDKLIDKLFFRTNTGRGDEKQLEMMGITNSFFKPLPYEEYLNFALHHKVGLTISTTRYEMCHRDIEYMAIGLPMIRVEYISKYYPEIIPNYHYISIDREGFELDQGADHIGGEKYIEAYNNRFKEVKDNRDLLNFISNNAYQYYKDFCSSDSRLHVLLLQLEL